MSINLLTKTKRKVHHYFIPLEANNHKPHFIRHKALHIYSAILIAVKVFVLAFLFISYPTPAKFSTVTSKRIVELVNVARQEQGLPILMENSALNESAMLKAQDMLAGGYFAHDNPQTGTTPWKWFKEAGYNYTFAGENLAMNFSEAEEAAEAWMKSPTHRANILNSNYTETGVAVVVGIIEGKKTTLVVQHFGKTFLSSRSSKFTRSNPDRAAPAIAGATQVSGGDAVEVAFKNTSERSLISRIAIYSQKFFWILLIFIGINLLLTIFIRITVQHKPIIVHSLFVIAIAVLALLINPHFIESVAGGLVKIL